MQSEILSEAIELLSEVHNKLSVLLIDDFPNLKLKSDNVLRVLINGFKVVNNQPIGDQTETLVTDFPPITSMFGKEIDFQKTPEKKPFVIDKSEFDSFKEKIDNALSVFEAISEKDILETFDDFTIRGIAKIAGIEVTPTDPEKVTVQFVKQIKDALAAKETSDTEISNLQKGNRGVDEDAQDVVLPALENTSNVKGEDIVPLPAIPKSDKKNSNPNNKK